MYKFITTLCALLVSFRAAAEVAPKITFEEYVQKTAIPRAVIDGFLRGPAWARFDPEVGYILRNSLVPWGIDNSVTIETTQSNGARTTLLYANKKARINTYGDSFTESAQVSDGETWQEYLAGHLGESVGNFGVGGHGVYQAYRRMLREEQTDHGAQYIILTICCDDPTRSLVRSRGATFNGRWNNQAGRMFHGNFWANLEMDLKSGQFVEKEQLLPTAESLYRMVDSGWMADRLRDDLALQLSVYVQGYVSDLDRKKVTRLAALLDFPFDWQLSASGASGNGAAGKAMSPMQVQADALFNRYGQRATQYILDKARAFARQRNKRLIVVLNNTTPFDRRLVRDDQEILGYLVREKFDFVDVNQSFLDEFARAKTSLSFADFMKQYLVNGRDHLNPRGNHFVAYSLKDKLVSMLDPKPIPYQPTNAESANWDGYLRGGGYTAR